MQTLTLNFAPRKHITSDSHSKYLITYKLHMMTVRSKSAIEINSFGKTSLHANLVTVKSTELIKHDNLCYGLLLILKQYRFLNFLVVKGLCL